MTFISIYKRLLRHGDKTLLHIFQRYTFVVIAIYFTFLPHQYSQCTKSRSNRIRNSMRTVYLMRCNSCGIAACDALKNAETRKVCGSRRVLYAKVSRASLESGPWYSAIHRLKQVVRWSNIVSFDSALKLVVLHLSEKRYHVFMMVQYSMVHIEVKRLNMIES